MIQATSIIDNATAAGVLAVRMFVDAENKQQPGLYLPWRHLYNTTFVTLLKRVAAKLSANRKSIEEASTRPGKVRKRGPADEVEPKAKASKLDGQGIPRYASALFIHDMRLIPLVLSSSRSARTVHSVCSR